MVACIGLQEISFFWWRKGSNGCMLW